MNKKSILFVVMSFVIMTFVSSNLSGQITFSTMYFAPFKVEVITSTAKLLPGQEFVTYSSCRGEDSQLYLSRSIISFDKTNGKNCMVLVHFVATVGKNGIENRLAMFYLNDDYSNHSFVISVPNGVLRMKTTDPDNKGIKVDWLYPNDDCIVHPENVVPIKIDSTKKWFNVGQWVWTNNIFVGDGIYFPNRWDKNYHILPQWFNNENCGYGSGNRLYLALVIDGKNNKEEKKVLIQYFYMDGTYEKQWSFGHVPEQSAVLLNW